MKEWKKVFDSCLSDLLQGRRVNTDNYVIMKIMFGLGYMAGKGFKHIKSSTPSPMDIERLR